MSTIANVAIPTTEFALRETFEELPDLTLDVERVVAHENDHITPYVWMVTDDPDRLEDVLERDPSVEGATLLETYEGEALGRMNWRNDIESLEFVLVEEEATILNARGHRDGWEFRILFPERDSLSRTHDFCDDHELSFDILSIHSMDNTEHGRFGLTELQHETLTTAIDCGYYDIPRRTSLEELAEEFDIAYQSLSERLRRAHRTLVENTVVVGPSDDEE